MAAEVRGPDLSFASDSEVVLAQLRARWLVLCASAIVERRRGDSGRIGVLEMAYLLQISVVDPSGLRG